MKLRNIIAVLASVAALTLGSTSRAATTNISDVAGLVADVTIKGTLLIQGPMTTNGDTLSFSFDKTSFNTSDLINLLGEATSNSFPAGARLILANDSFAFLVTTKDGDILADVSDFIETDNSTSVLKGKATISGSKAGKLSATVIAPFSFEASFDGSDLFFDIFVNLMVNEQITSGPTGNDDLSDVKLTFKGQGGGTGDINDDNGVLDNVTFMIKGKGRSSIGL